MEKILLKIEHALDFVESSISSCLTNPLIISDDKFHHNTKYKDAISIIRNGILSPSELNKLGIEGYTDDVIESMEDIESHANGSEAISLAVVGLEDISPDEFEYDPFSERYVDFLITSDIRARRVSTNYGNEYLSDKSIDTDKFRAIDIRLLSLIQTIRESTNVERDNSSVSELIDNYNKLRDMAKLLRERKLCVPLREMSSNEGVAIDIEKISSMPKVKIKI